MSSVFNPFAAAVDVLGSRKAPLARIPTQNAYPLFRGTPPFFARWALVLLSLNVMFTGNLVYECMADGELYFNPLQGLTSSNAKKTEDGPSATTSTTTPDIQTPQKPFWRRVSFAAFHVGVGGCIAAFLLSQRARSLRSIIAIRPSSPKSNQPRRVYLEASGHPEGYGHPLLIKDCSLAPTKMNKDLMMVLTRNSGKFFFLPLGSKIGEEQMPTTGSLAKLNMLKLWKDAGGKVTHILQ